MELGLDKHIHFSDADKVKLNGSLSCSSIPVSAARVVAERLIKEAEDEEAPYVAQNQLLYPDGANENDTIALPLEAWRKREVAKGLFDIADLEFGME